jgi:prepilin-type N-terminal cleavage/methylation domain-containing protein
MSSPEKKLVRAAARRESGMTLIEIMIVLAIIALVMGVLVGPKVFAEFKRAKVKTAWMEAKEFEGAYTRWASDNEDPCPASIDELLKYTNKKVATDPWKSKYVLKCGDQAPEGADVGILSWGPDKREGSADDVKSWEKQPN